MLVFGLTIVELLLAAVFIIALVVGVAWDRRGFAPQKWFILAVGLIVLAVWTWSSWTFWGEANIAAVMDGATVVTEAHTRVVFWDAIRSWALWEPIAYYILAGLIYATVETGIGIRKAARLFRAAWNKHLTRQTDAGATYQHVLQQVEISGADSSLFNEALSIITKFVGSHRDIHPFVMVQSTEDRLHVEPFLQKGVLSDHVGAWTIFWPFYLVSLVLGDLLTEIFRVIGNAFARASRFFMRFSFQDVFKA
jgi:hypothetical protein